MIVSAAFFVRDFAAVAGQARVDHAAADQALTRLEVDERGFDAMDRKYLLVIAETYGGGPVGAETLAAALSEQKDTVDEVIEPYLMQCGMVARTPRGRVLTDSGYRYLGLAVPAGRQADLLSEAERD